MFASLASPDDDVELHWLKDGRTRRTTGSVVSSLYHLKDPKDNNEDVGFFVFPDLSVRTEGRYRLKLSLFEVVSNNVRHCKSIYSAPFYVYAAKKFPGMEESTPLSCSLADQGIKIRIRKDIRVHSRPIPTLSPPIMNVDDSSSDDEGDEDESSGDGQPTKRAKRSGLDDTIDTTGGSAVSGLGPAQGVASQQQPGPPAANSVTIIPPPPPFEVQPQTPAATPPPSVQQEGPSPLYPSQIPPHPHPPPQQPQYVPQQPPAPQQQQPLVPQHVPPPPSHAHRTPLPQAYAPYPQWVPPPPPPQPRMYDTYYHHHHQQQHQQHHQQAQNVV